MSIKWTGNIEDRRIELLDQKHTYSQIARILSNEFNVPISRHAIKNRCVRSEMLNNGMVGNLMSANQFLSKVQTTQIPSIPQNKQNIIVQPKQKSNCNLPKNNVQNNIVPPQLSANKKLFPEKCYNASEEFTMIPSKIRELGDYYDTLTALRPKKILSLSDLHAPTIDFNAIDEALFYNWDADVIVLNGDFLDCQGMSRYDKMEDFNIYTELEQASALLDVLSNLPNVKNIVWVGGNHDLGRFQKYVMKNFSPAMRKYVYNRLNPMDVLAEQFEKLIVIPHNWMMIGDVLFAHLERYSSVSMKTVNDVNDVFLANNHLLPVRDYRALVIGHTHQMGENVKNGRKLIEQGCLTDLQDYRWQQPTKSRWETGYAVINFDDDVKVKFNDTRVYHIEQQPNWRD
jgi:predicted phosphodiesterase